jgi:TRAP transporter TAXI family solute receptor
MENLRGLASLYPETIQIVANADENIQTVADLAGKRVAVGAPGSGTEANARQILAAYGLTYDDIQPDYLSFGEASDNLKDGHVAAAFVTAGTPTAAITDLATTKDINIVPIASADAQGLIAEYPYYAEVVIPAGTYPKQDEDVNTVAVMAMLTVRAGLDEDMVYNITKAIFENLSDLEAAHARGGDVSLDTALAGMSLELHPGAQRYFDEVQ